MSITAIRSQGSGGQNVNKVATAIHLKFKINESSLSNLYKDRLLKLSHSTITDDGIIVIKAQRFRTQERNKEDAYERLISIISKVTKTQKKRKPTKPTKASALKRLDNKAKQKQKKSTRGRYKGED